MEIEHITSPPPEQTPQLRYASLHRAVEKGIASDRTWSELSLVCVELGLEDEARKWFNKVVDPAPRLRLQNQLIRRGLQVEKDHRLQQVTEADSRRKLTDDLQEAVQFLADGQMPLTVTVATATFPLVVGIGGYLTSGSQAIVLLLAAMLPAVLVLMAVAALGRRVLVDSATGIEDAPDLPPTRQLAREAGRVTRDGAGVVAALLGPAVALHFLGLSLRDVLIASAVGLYLLPMALILRFVRNDWRALAPSVLVPAVYRGGLRYFGRCLAVLTLLAPAAACWIASGGAVVYLQVALVGPLIVAPSLIAARLLGRFVSSHREDYRQLLNMPEPVRKSTATSKPKRARSQPAGRQRTNGTPRVQRSANGTPKRPGKPNGRPSPKPTGAVGQAARRSPAPEVPWGPRGGMPQAAGDNLVPKSEPLKDSAPTMLAGKNSVESEEIPDLMSMPGFNVVKGEARVRAGAAASPRR